jgi:hypothetical protein
MAFSQQNRIDNHHVPGLGRTRELFAAVLLVMLVVALVLRVDLSLDALAPAVATLAFAMAATTAGIAMLCHRDGLRPIWFDIAGVLTFVGIGITILIEPDQMVRLVSQPERPD